MKLGNYIHELLKNNDTVIIPGFGAFFSDYKPAEISETEIKPPSKIISFSSNIRNNDGLLVDYVANAENVSHFDALKLIEKERDNIVFLLDKGEEVILKKTGKLYSNEKNELEFIPVHDKNLSLETFGLEPISLEKLSEEHSEKEISETEHLSFEVISETKEDVFSDESQNLNESEDKIEETTINSEIISETVEADNKDAIKEDITDDQEIIDEREKAEPIVEPTFVNLQSEPEKENKKKAGWYWYLLILIPIIVAGYFVSQNMNKSVTNLTNSKETITPITPENPPTEIQSSEQPEIVIDSAVVVQKVDIVQDSLASEPEEENKEDELVPGEAVYYLIGGSFKDEENAMDYMEILKEKGFEPFFMGQKGNFYMVGVGKYATDGQAVRAREEMWETNPGAGLWVMKE